MYARSLWRHRYLLGQIVRRELSARYRGSVLGVLWAFVAPLASLLVFTFVFSVVFKARWQTDGESGQVAFALLLFVGMLMFGFVSECLSRAPAAVLGQDSYVKKVVFPLEILPVATVGAALVNLLVGTAILLLGVLATTHTVPWTALLFPALLLPLALFVLGACWFVASLGVFLRDVGQAITPLLQMLLFLSPVFYPLSALPEAFRPWMSLNPLAFFIEQGRAVLVFGQLPGWGAWFLHLLCASAVAWLGGYWFHRTRHAFADVM